MDRIHSLPIRRIISRLELPSSRLPSIHACTTTLWSCLPLGACFRDAPASCTSNGPPTLKGLLSLSSTLHLFNHNLSTVTQHQQCRAAPAIQCNTFTHNCLTSVLALSSLQLIASVDPASHRCLQCIASTPLPGTSVDCTQPASLVPRCRASCFVSRPNRYHRFSADFKSTLYYYAVRCEDLALRLPFLPKAEPQS
jgi:hypothetical protein